MMVFSAEELSVLIDALAIAASRRESQARVLKNGRRRDEEARVLRALRVRFMQQRMLQHEFSPASA